MRCKSLWKLVNGALNRWLPPNRLHGQGSFAAESEQSVKMVMWGERIRKRKGHILIHTISIYKYSGIWGFSDCTDSWFLTTLEYLKLFGLNRWLVCEWCWKALAYWHVRDQTQGVFCRGMIFGACKCGVISCSAVCLYTCCFGLKDNIEMIRVYGQKS